MQKTELSDPYFHEIHEGIEEEAAKWRFHAEVAFTMHEKNRDWESLRCIWSSHHGRGDDCRCYFKDKKIQ